MSSDFNVVIVAGGVGNRMKSVIPKQFLSIKEKPIIVHTISAFLEAQKDIFICIAAPKEHLEMMRNIIQSHFQDENILICEGGETRFHSVKNALQHCNGKFVMIHDAVRPCIDANWLKNLMKTVEIHKSAIPYVKLNDSLRMMHQGKYVYVNREDFIRIQTPQCFELTTLKKAFEKEYSPAFTDDASVWESEGNDLFFVEGLERNIKITTPDDLDIATHFLQKKK